MNHNPQFQIPPNDPMQMFNVGPNSRPQSVASIGQISHTPQTPIGSSGPATPFMNMFTNNPFVPMVNPFVPSSQSDRINDWHPWHNIAMDGAKVPQSMLSQLSFGAVPSQISLMSQNSRSVIKKIERDEFQYVINCLSKDFNISEMEININCVKIIKNLSNLDKEQTKEVMDALWTALFKIDYRQLIEDPDTKLQRFELLYTFVNHLYNLVKPIGYDTIVSKDDREKQRVVRNLLCLIQYKAHEAPINLINMLINNSHECQRILSLRNDPAEPLMNSMETLKIACRELNNTNFKQKPRLLYSLFRIILVIISHRSDHITKMSRKELMDYYIYESLPLTTNIFNDCLQTLGKCANPALTMHRSYVETFNSVVRVISRLLCYLSESENYVRQLVDVNIIEILTAAQQIPPKDKTGLEIRINATKIYANLSTMKEKLRHKDLHKPIKFIFDCIHDITGLENNYNVQNVFDVIVYGTGFLSNLSIYNSKAKEQITREFVPTVLRTCCNCLQLLLQDQPPIQKSFVTNLLTTTENCINILCHLNDHDNVLKLEVTRDLFNLQDFILFTGMILAPKNALKKLDFSLQKTIIKAWERSFSYGFFPLPPSNNNPKLEISSILLNFFANYIQYPIETEDRVHVMEKVIELLRYLIENHSIYSGIIESHLCEKNAQWMPFQVLNKLNPVNASLMLKFLYLCCKFEGLKRQWASTSEYDHNGNINQQILRRFQQSTDSQIHTISSLINQQLFGNDYDMSSIF